MLTAINVCRVLMGFMYVKNILPTIGKIVEIYLVV